VQPNPFVAEVRDQLELTAQSLNMYVYLEKRWITNSFFNIS
jgi:hypothetical protein